MMSTDEESVSRKRESHPEPHPLLQGHILLCAATPLYSSPRRVIDIHSLMLQLPFSVAKSIMGSCEHPWTYQMIKDDTSLFEQISEII